MDSNKSRSRRKWLSCSHIPHSERFRASSWTRKSPHPTDCNDRQINFHEAAVKSNAQQQKSFPEVCPNFLPQANRNSRNFWPERATTYLLSAGCVEQEIVKISGPSAEPSHASWPGN